MSVIIQLEIARVHVKVRAWRDESDLLSFHVIRSTLSRHCFSFISGVQRSVVDEECISRRYFHSHRAF